MEGIIGQSPAMQRLFRSIERIGAATDVTVLIQGESGTGKELISRAIHQRSARRNAALVAINCASIPEELMESELFGHIKGSFTGASFNRQGRFEQAKGGTFFLDEIGDMSMKLQAKLLRVLQERVIEPVGAAKSVSIDVRVIAATHKNLEEEVGRGRFREDLFYRLNVIALHVPPLRDRGEDIPLLIEHFTRYCAERYQRGLTFHPETMAILRAYRWPGNVRELQHTIERVSVLCERDEVVPDDLPEKFFRPQDLDFDRAYENAGANPVFYRGGIGGLEPRVDAVDGGGEDAADPVELEDFGEDGIDFNRAVEEFENRLILSALEKTGWNKNKAAHMLNLNRTTLVEKIKKKGLAERVEK